ncbi:transmembrane protein, putative (macronuclear) [Tetrahymena thermophila SB210]|uniref:Transmembrane protein, putative n=1 Tax=Tetrahymena thermophila (strain SB210) TaxID=312017 RepID=I7MA12_TETTS|nr:transmembrane protein, putative [Tetrahymena thermophila SB210]EAS03196.2 transmembrane protein, putative [Tetrahymena thermophila SB210]|eukprot:XP_001023441.2 transmembrane protein, putative [Tetrahymena thermophila SB210]
MSSVLQTCDQLSLQICSHLLYCWMNAQIKSLLIILAGHFVFIIGNQFLRDFMSVQMHSIIQCAHFFEDEQMCCRKLTQSRRIGGRRSKKQKKQKPSCLAIRNLFPKLTRKRRASQLCKALLHRYTISITFQKIQFTLEFQQASFHQFELSPLGCDSCRSIKCYLELQLQEDNSFELGNIMTLKFQLPFFTKPNPLNRTILPSRVKPSQQCGNISSSPSIYKRNTLMLYVHNNQHSFRQTQINNEPYFRFPLTIISQLQFADLEYFKFLILLQTPRDYHNHLKELVKLRLSFTSQFTLILGRCLLRISTRNTTSLRSSSQTITLLLF